ncbi:MAG: transketolase [Firmicutes bacterium]|nr:transketolase [Bacillota bacterium]
MTEEERIALAEQARRIRGHIIRMLAAAGSGHSGGSLSAVEILTLLYFRRMRYDPKDPKRPDRDRFVLSKGHAAPVLYATLAEAGFFPVEVLTTLRRFGSILQGHPDMRKTPGVEMSTGSLGQGLSAANGMALAGKLDGKDYRVYVLLGDGETEEGQIWEAAMTAVHYKLDNLTVFLDYNHLQIDGRIEEVKSNTDPAGRFRAFGWHVLEADGHDFAALDRTVDEAQATKGKPTMIVAHTIKGKGVSFMENQVGWHGIAPKPEEAQKALAELGLV